MRLFIEYFTPLPQCHPTQNQLQGKPGHEGWWANAGSQPSRQSDRPQGKIVRASSDSQEFFKKIHVPSQQPINHLTHIFAFFPRKPLKFPLQLASG
jgi:hypothetical protein